MSHGAAILTLLFQALVSHAQDAPESSCVPVSSGEKMEYDCSGIILQTNYKENQAIVSCNDRVINCSELPSLPFAGGKHLQGLGVYNCGNISSCLLSVVNATGVSDLFVWAAKTPITPDTVQGFEMINTLTIFKDLPGSRTTIPMDVIKRLPNLKILRFNEGGIISLTPNAFNGTLPELLKLEFVINSISVIPEDAFNGLVKLKNLTLHKNKIETIDENAFRGLSSLERLFLNENSLSVLPAGLLQHAPHLLELTVEKNQRKLRVQTGALSGLVHLKELVLQSYVELVLDPACLSQLPSLRILNLKDSGITVLPADLLLNDTALADLDLSKNELRSLPETVFSDLKNLSKLDLSNNKLEAISRETFQPLMLLQELYLDRNLIQTLDKYLFTTLKKLHTISLSHNRITEIDTQAFYSAAVIDLNLSYNQLAWECIGEDQTNFGDRNIHYESMIIQSPLSMLNEMKRLNLSHNNISAICSDWTTIMAVLDTLDLSFNKLGELTAADINFLADVTVDLRNNNITSLTPPATYSKDNLILQIGRNPFHCDCHIYELLKIIKEDKENPKTKEEKTFYNVDEATCHEPRSLKGVDLTSLADGNLAKPISLMNISCPLPDTPKGCSCLVRPEKKRTECDCYDLRNKTLPNPEYNGVTINKMMLTLHTARDLERIPSFVTELNLSNIALETIPEDLPVTVTHIDLRGNNLQKIPLSILQRNLTLKMSRNPIKCECSNIENVENLQRYQFQIEDYQSLVCTDGAFVQQVDAVRLCDVQFATAIGASFAAVGIFLAILGTLIYRYSLEIKIYLFNRGWTWLVKEEMLDANKKYDIFLSYVHEDEEFVQKTLLTKLEEKGYKVCIHTRDWIVGDRIVDQIYRSVAESRRTLIVLSNSFLESNSWALEEFRAAHTQTEVDKFARAVVIILGDVDCDKAPDHIKRHMKMNTYIKWGDSLFWERLKYALPRKIKAEDLRRKDLTKQAIKTLGDGGLNVVVNEDGKLVNTPALRL